MSSKSKATIAEKMAQLDVLIEWFNGGDFNLEQALDKFSEAEKLAAEIETDLLTLRNEVTVVKAKFDEAV